MDQLVFHFSDVNTWIIITARSLLAKQTFIFLVYISSTLNKQKFKLFFCYDFECLLNSSRWRFPCDDWARRCGCSFTRCCKVVLISVDHFFYFTCWVKYHFDGDYIHPMRTWWMLLHSLIIHPRRSHMAFMAYGDYNQNSRNPLVAEITETKSVKVGRWAE